MSKLLMSAIIGFGIVGGQYCLATFSRGLSPPWSIVNLISQVLLNPWLYLAGLFYVLAIGLYLWLLRHGAISATNLPIMAVIVGCNIMFSLLPGEGLSTVQIAGAICIGAGILLMQVG